MILLNSHIIIGYGDVAKNRLYPELCRRGDSIIKLFDVKQPDNEQGNLIIRKDDAGIISEISRMPDNIVWISTPSNSHVPYLKELVRLENKLIVVEKPISITNSDLRVVEEINKNYRNKIFYLSYYLLEKALPLYYLKTRNNAYLNYLNIGDGALLNADLGKLNSVHVRLFEGADNRNWVNDQGGQLFETMIHNVLIASLFAGLPETWKDVELKEVNNKLSITASINKTSVRLEQQKYANKCERFAKFNYEKGVMFMNLDKQILFIQNKKGTTEISIKKEFLYKYAVQVDLVNRVANNELKTSECDGLFNQNECLKWLNSLKFLDIKMNY